jgi:hypothetical protein
MSIPNKTCIVHILLQDPLQSLKTACALVDFYNRYSIILNSLHEPNVYVIAKGKDHKQYEYGNKVSIVSTKDTNIIVGVNLNLEVIIIVLIKSM